MASAFARFGRSGVFCGLLPPLSRETRWDSARCESSGNATWLQVTHIGGAADRRPLLMHLQDPALGLHVLDVNIALGNLVQLVRDEAAAYRHP